MFEESHAGKAGSVTPVVLHLAPLDQFSGFQRDDYRFKAMVSKHEIDLEIAKTTAWTGVLKLAILALVIAGVLVCAMVLGVPVPWELVLPILSKAVTSW